GLSIPRCSMALMAQLKRITYRLVPVAFVLMGTLQLDAERAAPKGSVQIRALYDDSSLVAIGRVEKTHRISAETHADPNPRAMKITVEHNQALVHLLRIYKGSSERTIPLDFTLEIPPTSQIFGPDLTQGEVALMFLQPSDDGAYRFASDGSGKYPLGGCITEGGGEPLGMLQIEADLTPCLESDQVNASQALDVLLGFEKVSPATEARLSFLTSSDDAGLAAEALTVLLNTKRNKYYSALEDFLRRRGNSVPPEEINLLFGRIQDPGLEGNPAIFNRLSDSPLPAIKLAAMYAIRKIRSPQSISTLIKHLSDSDPNIEFLAVVTLNAIVRNGNEYGPTNYDFDRQPQVYIRRWKQWWQETGRTQYVP
ncbi:MAG: HEAT repeat domain-containing protein, partial [Terracidiphilus sp.]